MSETDEMQKYTIGSVLLLWLRFVVHGFLMADISFLLLLLAQGIAMTSFLPAAALIAIGNIPLTYLIVQLRIYIDAYIDEIDIPKRTVLPAMTMIILALIADPLTAAVILAGTLAVWFVPQKHPVIRDLCVCGVYAAILMTALARCMADGVGPFWTLFFLFTAGEYIDMVSGGALVDEKTDNVYLIALRRICLSAIPVLAGYGMVRVFGYNGPLSVTAVYALTGVCVLIHGLTAYAKAKENDLAMFAAGGSIAAAACVLLVLGIHPLLGLLALVSCLACAAALPVLFRPAEAAGDDGDEDDPLVSRVSRFYAARTALAELFVCLMTAGGYMLYGQGSVLFSGAFLAVVLLRAALTAVSWPEAYYDPEEA